MLLFLRSLGTLRFGYLIRYDGAFAINGDLPSLSHKDWAIYQAFYFASSGHPCFSRKFLEETVSDEVLPEGITEAARKHLVNFDSLVPSSVKESHARRLSKNNIGQQAEISNAYP